MSKLAPFMRFLPHILGFLAAMMLVACNDEVFVVDLTPSKTVIEFSEDGGTESIAFNTPGWKIPTLYMYGAGSDAYYILEDGKELNIWPPSLEGNGTLVIREGKRLAATVSRNSPRSLEVTMGENRSTGRRIITIMVSDDLFQKQIQVFQKGSVWTLEGIDWDTASAVFGTSIEPTGEPLTIDNKGIEDVVMKVNVFENCTATVQFLEAAQPEGECPNFPDPDARAAVPAALGEDGALIFNGMQASYNGMEQEFTDGMPQVEKDIAFKPGRHTYQILIEYNALTVGYTARLRSSSRNADIKGTLTVKTPTGKWYGIWEE